MSLKMFKFILNLKAATVFAFLFQNNLEKLSYLSSFMNPVLLWLLSGVKWSCGLERTYKKNQLNFRIDFRVI